MISTADTSVFAVNGEPLSHLYGFGTRTNGVSGSGGAFYRDSLFYVDIQDLGTAFSKPLRIATLDESRKGSQKLLDTRISLGFSICDRPEIEDPIKRADINNDLYLIRNAKGEYLCVPIYSITDSVYWVTPGTYEDPTQIPSYQWVVERKSATGNAVFKLTNREFEKVTFDYVYLDITDKKIVIGDAKYSGAGFTKSKIEVPAGVVNAKTQQAIRKNHFEDVKLYDQNEYSFLALDKSVKIDQLLGYTYIDRDSTIVDIYAFKYLHFLATGADAHFFGWNGFNTPKVDTVVYVNTKSYHDKLYFALEEMEYANIGKDRLLIGYNPDGSKLKDLDNYKALYDKFGKKANNYVNKDSLVMENFGYWPGLTADKKDIVPDLLPLARQAYRLLLKDYYKYYPTVRGDYMTVGQQDNYILANKVQAAKPYVFGSGNAEGVFGVPYFYFRNTNFNYKGVSNGVDVIEDYFALVQRIDTITAIQGFTSSMDAIEEYLEINFANWGTPGISKRVVDQVRESGELGVFVALVSDDRTKLKMAVRGDAAIRVSTFTLERDADPIYRRFHWNDRFERTFDDSPLTLEFHRLLNDAHKLFENNGSDKSQGGGHYYNLDENGVLSKDSVGQIISFLGIKNKFQHPSLSADGNPHGNTNYAIYVDTAFIRRGTGWIKPQYMFVVDPLVKESCRVCEANAWQDFRGFTIGRYMFNTAMYAKKVTPSADDKVVNYDLVQPINDKQWHEAINGVTGKAYTEISSLSNYWERLAFSWAIHRGDSLYVLKGIAPEYQGRQYDPQLVIDQLAKEYSSTQAKDNINFDSLKAVKGWSMAKIRAAGKTIGLHAIIALDDNTHKDWVFSLRFIERNADDFVIESETTLRDRKKGEIIRPGYAGWIKWENSVPTISRGDTKELMGEGEAWNVEISKLSPVDNDDINGDSDVKVIGGFGAVTIQNATGKNVVISNILGQTLANTKLNSDNASIALPAGVVVVAVEGESAVKAIIK